MTTEKREKNSASLETSYIKLWKKEKILFCEYADNIDISLEIAKECVEKRIAFSEGKNYPVFINMKGVRSLTKEAREYLAVEGARLIIAGALITGSPLTKILGNVFLTVNKPQVPTRLFINENEALEWLKKYL